MNKKTYGVITFHRAINYGALLQGYALTKAIGDAGGRAKMIDYRCPFIEDAYRLTWGINKRKPY